MVEVKRTDGRIELIKYPNAHDEKGNINPNLPSKYRTIVLDTVNALQNNLYQDMMAGKGNKGSYDEWKDFGLEIYELYNYIKKLPDTVLVQILSYEGGGKTVGGKYLDPSTNVWLNADAKPLSFSGARQMYPVDNSLKNYLVVETYDETKSKIKAIHEKRKGTLIVFSLGHIEDFKSENNLMRQRLKVLGKQATKLGIEGLNVFSTLYGKIDPNISALDFSRYKLTTMNSGFNTARTPEGYWDGVEIPNNYQIVVDKILEDFGELKPLQK